MTCSILHTRRSVAGRSWILDYDDSIFPFDEARPRAINTAKTVARGYVAHQWKI